MAKPGAQTTRLLKTEQGGDEDGTPSKKEKPLRALKEDIFAACAGFVTGTVAFICVYFFFQYLNEHNRPVYAPEDHIFEHDEHPFTAFEDAPDSSIKGPEIIPPADPTPPSPSDFSLTSDFWTSEAVQVESGPESVEWAPLIFTECVSGMEDQWAPCMVEKAKKIAAEDKKKNPIEASVVRAEEWVFPPFVLRFPYFPNDKYREAWLKPIYDKGSLKMRRYDFSIVDNELHYVHELRAQNLVFSDVVVAQPEPEEWSHGCFSTAASHRSALAVDKRPKGQRTEDADLVFFARSPESHTFQYFMGRVTHLLIQSRHLWNSVKKRGGKIKMIGGEKPGRINEDMMEMLGIGAGERVYGGGPEKAKQIVYNCRSVLMHPWFFLRFTELMGVMRDTPMEERKTVFYLPPKGDFRKVLNEEVLLEVISKRLEERGQGETLVVLDSHRTAKDMLQLLGKNARAIIGPHGGKFYNMLFCPKNTLVIEFNPPDRGGWSQFYEYAAMLDFVYAQLPISPTAKPEHNMFVPPDHVLQILDEHLGKIPSSPMLMHKSVYLPKEVLFA
uniref:Glycosyltransferase 61 catalytic domain-containing protein n=1 Tax=Chromera velia CCMP2878 TaxID=1169474 RepID=A0A0G4GDN1_9ALVE|mmetsp:Transcript_27189/g.53423  ORF Transcript_27189/g.53423 Transcript_27189/m.53423 type:complete len:556 (+) Transcript_27189:160-1827(+)|eukprot:Cvel_21428.t1-p1 / transcript=Cvel_21428.t1 / gene=Cvel_21428 / organism=Chromera_velia_CCMP2878 / gene_product=hypothetical protein / transcript_product=hypothetical protein / location=Cvel_scaffold2008:31727-34425(-) / protein_length=555 / sequence_SO=supercontig / SO=protein_coding / is_pseudo=false